MLQIACTFNMFFSLYIYKTMLGYCTCMGFCFPQKRYTGFCYKPSKLLFFFFFFDDLQFKKMAWCPKIKNKNCRELFLRSLNCSSSISRYMLGHILGPPPPPKQFGTFFLENKAFLVKKIFLCAFRGAAGTPWLFWLFQPIPIYWITVALRRVTECSTMHKVVVMVIMCPSLGNHALNINL